MTKEHEAEQSQNPLGYSIQFWKPVLRHSQGGAREGTELFCKKEAWYILDLFLEKTILCQVWYRVFYVHSMVTLYFVLFFL